MPLVSQYIKTLFTKYSISPGKRREFLDKLINNFIWHLTPTDLQIQRMKEVLEQFNIKGMFFVTANLLERRPERWNVFKNHEIAPHGYRHLDYSMMNYQEALIDMQKAVDIFRNHGVLVDTFRAPYATPLLKDGSSWYQALKCTNVKYSSSQLQDLPPFVPMQKQEGIIEFPIAYPTDDAIIQYAGVKDPRGMVKLLLKKIYLTRKTLQNSPNKANLLFFCLHPLRIGQAKYIQVLEKFLQGIQHTKFFELETFSVAIKRWQEGDRSHLVAITGDIDCWTYVDYLRRAKYT